MWEHYLFTNDKEFLAKRAYPAMKQASQFFLDFLVKDPNTGFLVTAPSFSPEILVDKPAADILRFLKQLPETTALVFNLHVVEGYKHKEIAQMLCISEGTSKWHVSEAKKQLSQLLEKRARA